MSSYFIPDCEIYSCFRLEENIKRSRFIVSLAHTKDACEARKFIDLIRKEFPNASHNTWAYVACEPKSTAETGYSDDGEPHGTAGRPMLAILQHSGIGEICAVVTRYFGGIKLGTGGLVRAYQKMVSLALEAMPTRLCQKKARLDIAISYKHINSLHNLLPAFSVTIEKENYSERASFSLILPEENITEFCKRLTCLGDKKLTIKSM